MKRNRAPPPGLVVTSIVPPWASTMALQIARPTPLDALPSPRRKGFEDPSAVERGHADATIGDPQLHHANALDGRPSPGADIHRGALRGVAGRVLEQVGDHLVQLAVVGVDQWQLRRHVDLHPYVAEERGEAANPLGDQLVERHCLAVRLQRAGFDAAEAQEVGDDTVKAFGLVADEVQEVVAGGVVVRGAVAEVGGDGPDGGQRRAQVVRYRPQEGGAVAVHLLQHREPGGLGGEALPFRHHGFVPVVQRLGLPGMTIEDVLGDYPDLVREDLLAALEFGALAAGMRRVVPLAG